MKVNYKRVVQSVKKNYVLYGCLASLLLLFLYLAQNTKDSTLAFRGSIPAKPWMDPREVAVVQQYLDKSKTMLEYGSGGSTRYYAPKTGRYVSIESDVEWCNGVKRELNIGKAGSDYEHVSMICQKPEVDPLPCKTFVNSWDWLFGRCYTKLSEVNRYVTAPSTFFPDLRYDVVLVDGRGRPQCAVEALPLLKTDTSIVLIHDWLNRDQYHVVLNFFDIVDQTTESNQSGGGGIVSLRPKSNWREIYRTWDPPSWWN